MLIKLMCALALSTLLFVARDATAEAPNSKEITYKGTKFGVSEKQFSLKHSNEGFVCDVALDKVGRSCTSNEATYGGMKAQTTATFIRDRLILVRVFFPKEPEDTFGMSGVIKDVLVPQQLEDIYGPPDEVRWPEEGKNGFKIWKKVWKRQNGTTATYQRTVDGTDDPGGGLRYVYLISGDADRAHRQERKNRRPDI